jgi:hypothetical protein
MGETPGEQVAGSQAKNVRFRPKADIQAYLRVQVH